MEVGMDRKNAESIKLAKMLKESNRKNAERIKLATTTKLAIKAKTTEIYPYVRALWMRLDRFGAKILQPFSYLFLAQFRAVCRTDSFYACSLV